MDIYQKNVQYEKVNPISINRTGYTVSTSKFSIDWKKIFVDKKYQKLSTDVFVRRK